MIGLCCGGGWRWRGICRRYAELVIVGTWAMFSGPVEGLSWCLGPDLRIVDGTGKWKKKMVESVGCWWLGCWQLLELS